MDVLAANAVVAEITLRMAPRLAPVLNMHLDLKDLSDPRVPADRQRDFQTECVNALFKTRGLSTQELFTFAEALNVLGRDRRLYDQVWAHVVRTVAPYSLAAAAVAGHA